MKPLTLILSISLVASTALAQPKERWVYAPANYEVNEQADRIIAAEPRDLARQQAPRDAILLFPAHVRKDRRPDWRTP